jgi:SAM-dependent methyltransferase
MCADGPSFYDDDAVFRAYMQHRQRPDSPNNALELPILRELLGDLRGRRILDLGCGDAALGWEALAQGCQSYIGLEGSHNMVAVARETLADTPGQVVHATIERWDYPPARFDLVVSRLALHYIGDLAQTLALVYRTLESGGRLVFSVEHPVITSSDRGWTPGTQRQDWLVDDYFVSGERVTRWLGGQVRKYHRTVEEYFGGLQQAGFVVESLRESRPRRERFADQQTYRRRQRIPLLLLLAARKP